MSDAAAPPNAAAAAAAASSANAVAPPDDLGPFAPPAGFEFPPELQGLAPRRAPRSIQAGSHASGWRKGLLFAAQASVICMIASRLDFVQYWSYFIPPLAGLFWIGAAGLAATLIAWIWQKMAPSRLEYIIKGQPVAVRVLDVQIVAEQQAASNMTINGVPVQAVIVYKMAAVFDFPHPELGKMVRGAAFSEPIQPGSDKTFSRYQCALKPGDYATAVYLPEEGLSSLTLYGCLGLNPNIHFALKDGKPLHPVNVAALILYGMVGLVAFLGGIVFLIQFLGSLSPVEPNEGLIAGIFFAAFAGFSVLAALLIYAAKGKNAVEGKTAGRLKSACGMGALTGFFLALFVAMPGALLLNAWWGHQESKFRLVKIEHFWQQTWSGIISNYEIKYHYLPGSNTQSLSSTPKQMAPLTPGKLALLEIRPGAFAGPWVKDIIPLEAEGEALPESTKENLKIALTIGIQTPQGFQAISLSKEENNQILREMEAELKTELKKSLPPDMPMPAIALEFREK
jgi:hypothetical protein